MTVTVGFAVNAQGFYAVIFPNSEKKLRTWLLQNDHLAFEESFIGVGETVIPRHFSDRSHPMDPSNYSLSEYLNPRSVFVCLSRILSMT